MSSVITDRRRLKDVEASQLASNETQMNGTAKAVVSLAHTRTYVARVTDGGTAGTAVAETPIARTNVQGILRNAEFVSPVAVAADPANYVTFTLSKRTAGGAAVTIATLSTQSTAQGAVTAFAPLSFVLAATSAIQLSAADVLTVTVAKAGTGQAIATSTVNALVSVELEEN